MLALVAGGRFAAVATRARPLAIGSLAIALTLATGSLAIVLTLATGSLAIILTLAIALTLATGSLAIVLTLATGSLSLVAGRRWAAGCLTPACLAVAWPRVADGGACCGRSCFCLSGRGPRMAGRRRAGRTRRVRHERPVRGGVGRAAPDDREQPAIFHVFQDGPAAGTPGPGPSS